MNLLCFLVMAGLGYDQGSILNRDLTSEHCGVACIYGILKLNDVSASLEEVESRILSLHPTAQMGELTLHQLRTTIQSFGLYAASFQSDRNPRRIPTPAIIYLRPEKVGGDHIGHVVLLRSISNENAYICDFAAGNRKQKFTTDQLNSFWDGELIVVSREAPSFRAPIEWIIPLAVLAICGGLLFRSWWCRGRVRSSTAPFG